MLAYLVAGLIVGALARVLQHDEVPLVVQLVVGAVAGALGGVVLNVVLGQGVLAVDPWGFAVAALVGFVAVVLVVPRVRRNDDRP